MKIHALHDLRFALAGTRCRIDQSRELVLMGQDEPGAAWREIARYSGPRELFASALAADWIRRAVQDTDEPLAAARLVGIADQILASVKQSGKGTNE